MGRQPSSSPRRPQRPTQRHLPYHIVNQLSVTQLMELAEYVVRRIRMATRLLDTCSEASSAATTAADAKKRARSAPSTGSRNANMYPTPTRRRPTTNGINSITAGSTETEIALFALVSNNAAKKLCMTVSQQVAQEIHTTVFWIFSIVFLVEVRVWGTQTTTGTLTGPTKTPALHL